MDEPKIPESLKQKLTAYRSSAETVELIRQTPILLLVGVSGAGKNTVKQQLVKIGKYHEIVSHTTRQPRENKGVMEQDGREYHFIDFAEAERMLNSGEFVEAKMYSDNIYGTSVAEFQKALADGKTAVADIEVQGVAEYKAMAPQVKAVFLLPPSYDVWQERLKQRYADYKADPDDLHRRRDTAKRELEEALSKDYYTFVINDDIDAAVEAVNVIARGSDRQEDKPARSVAQDLLAQL